MAVQRATRVLRAPRRGSSWPQLIETEAGCYLTKLRGSGQGPAALVAEIVVAELADALGLRVPARVLVRIDETLTSENQDPEVLELLAASRGLNLGFELLHGARDLQPSDILGIGPDEASLVAWLDGLVMNPDRSPHNPNLMIRKGALWLIDHGAALTFQHDWRTVTEQSPRRQAGSLAAHVLFERATKVREWDGLLAETLGREVLEAAVRAVPDEFLAPLLPRGASLGALARRREAYVAFLWKRLKAPRAFWVAP